MSPVDFVCHAHHFAILGPSLCAVAKIYERIYAHMVTENCLRDMLLYNATLLQTVYLEINCKIHFLHVCMVWLDS